MSMLGRIMHGREGWRDALRRAAVAETDQEAAAALVDALCILLEEDRRGELATARRIRRLIRVAQRSGRNLADLVRG
jgi:hypothetical protein